MSTVSNPGKIRALATDDRESWGLMFTAYAEFYQVPLEQEAMDAVWGWIFDEHNDFWCTVAENDEGDLIGFTQYQLMHRSLSGGMVIYLSDLFVEPAIRGAGTGRALIDHVFEFARERGIVNVRWLTQDYNYPARKLYDSYGRKSDFLLYSFPV